MAQVQAPERGQVLFLTGAVLVVILTASVIYFTSSPRPLATGTQRTFTEYNDFASSSSNSSVYLNLAINATSISPGQTVSIAIAERNAFNTQVVLPHATSWPISGLSLGPCGSVNYPYGFGVSQGYYDSSNISDSHLLAVYQPGAFMCPMILADITAYAFQPSSDLADVQNPCNDAQALCPPIVMEMFTTNYLAKYWNGPSSIPFSTGTYTIVAGDEWGAMAILHFSVSTRVNSGTYQPQSVKLSLTLNTSQLVSGHTLNINADVSNLLPTTNNLTAGSTYVFPFEWQWIASAPCPFYLHLFVFQGDYGPTDVSQGIPLQTGTLRIIACPALTGRFYVFQPNSDSMQISNGLNTSMGFPLTLSGYYPAGQIYNDSISGGGVHSIPFPPGDYTVFAEDGWGQTALAHFSVTSG